MAKYSRRITVGPTCGEYGGVTSKGLPCSLPAGWGRGVGIDTGPCDRHIRNVVLLHEHSPMLQKAHASHTRKQREKRLLNRDADEKNRRGRDKKRRKKRLKSSKRTKRAVQRQMIAALSYRGVITQAAEDTGITSARHNNWMQKDPWYREQVDKAMEAAADRLEAEAIRRGVEGTVEPVGWYKGEPGGYVRRYSDTLLKMLLSGRRHKVFGTQRHEHSGQDGGPIQTEDVSKTRDDLIRKLDEIASRLEGDDDDES